MKHLGILALLLVAVSCSTIHYREFTVAAINTQEEEIPCVVLVDNQVYLDDANEPVQTPARIRLGFEARSDGLGYRKITVGVKSVELDADKKIIRGLRDEDVPQYFENSRQVQHNDAIRQLFILHRNPNYVGSTGN